MARKYNVLKDREAKVDNTLGKYNYGTGFGWCSKRNKGKKSKSYYKSGGHQK